MAGIAAQLIGRDSALFETRPELTQAVILAGAWRSVPMPSPPGGYNADHEGVGTVNAYWAHNAAGLNGASKGGYKNGTFTSDTSHTYTFSVPSGKTVKVALVWSSGTSGSDIYNMYDALTVDLDLIVTHPTGTAISDSALNAYESVEFFAASAGTVVVKVDVFRIPAAYSRTYGLAWTISP